MFTLFRWLGLTEDSLPTSARTAVAAMVSLLVARGLKMPEILLGAHLHNRDPALHHQSIDSGLAALRGNCAGCFLGAVIATCFHPHWISYGVGIFLCGTISAALPLTAAFRFATIALSVVLLITHDRPPWIVATDRFIEASVGIAVALLVAVTWPLPSRPT